MAVMRDSDRALFSATELKVIESSTPALIKSYQPRQLNARMVRVRKYADKHRDLVREQQRATKKGPRPGRPQELSNLRSKRKAQLFADALQRFEKRAEQVIKQTLAKQTADEKRAAKGPRRSGAQRETLRRRQQRRQAADAAASQPRIARQLKKTKQRAIQGHIRARGKRQQAKRDSR